MNDFLSSTRTFDLKSHIAALIKRYDYLMVLNVVLHRRNIDHVEQILDMAQQMGAEYVELANTQYYGWAWPASSSCPVASRCGARRKRPTASASESATA